MQQIEAPLARILALVRLIGDPAALIFTGGAERDPIQALAVLFLFLLAIIFFLQKNLRKSLLLSAEYDSSLMFIFE